MAIAIFFIILILINISAFVYIRYMMKSTFDKSIEEAYQDLVDSKDIREMTTFLSNKNIIQIKAPAEAWLEENIHDVKSLMIQTKDQEINEEFMEHLTSLSPQCQPFIKLGNNNGFWDC